MPPEIALALALLANPAPAPKAPPFAGTPNGKFIAAKTPSCQCPVNECGCSKGYPCNCGASILLLCTIDNCPHCDTLKRQLDKLPKDRWAVEVRKNDWEFFETWCVKDKDGRTFFPQLILADPDRTFRRTRVGATSPRELSDFLSPPKAPATPVRQSFAPAYRFPVMLSNCST